MLSRFVALFISLILNASLSQIPCLHRPAFSSSCHLCDQGLSLAGGGGHRYIYPKQFDQYYPNDTVSYPPKTGWGIPKDIPVSATLRLGCQAALLTSLALCPPR